MSGSPLSKSNLAIRWRLLRDAGFAGLALALACMTSCSGSQSSGGADVDRDDIKIRVNSPTAWKHLATGYTFEIGSPRGWSTGLQDAGKMYWRSGPREFRVFLRKTTKPTTAEQAMAEALDMIKSQQVELQAGEPTTLEFGGLTFLHCDFEFTNAATRRGNGFLYTAVDGDVAISINAEEYEGGDPERLAIAHAAARTFHNMKVKGPGALQKIPRQ